MTDLIVAFLEVEKKLEKKLEKKEKKIQRFLNSRFMSSMTHSHTIESISIAIEKLKEEKKAVKGNAQLESDFILKLKEFNLIKSQLIKESGLEDSDKSKRFNLKVPKGTKDYTGM